MKPIKRRERLKDDGIENEVRRIGKLKGYRNNTLVKMIVSESKPNKVIATRLRERPVRGNTICRINMKSNFSPRSIKR